ncbi:hypothetical protein [Rhizobium leguminosarum]|uniref:hypothetical protein n=1 Tax=Rhizobium leguminosarum TaxID=384 RepID=UPI0012BD7F0D|nr:hypothetical protein [Rhizobium leguminosarum]
MFFKPGYGFPQLAAVVQELSCGKFSREINRSGGKMMSLKLISGMMKSSGDEALLAMDAGGANQMVVIDRAALLEVAEPRRCDENRLQENIELFSRIASAKYDRGDVEPDGRIRISADDLLSWRQGAHVKSKPASIC